MNTIRQAELEAEIASSLINERVNTGLEPNLFLSDAEQNFLIFLLKPDTIFLENVASKYVFAKNYIETLQTLKQTC